MANPTLPPNRFRNARLRWNHTLTKTCQKMAMDRLRLSAITLCALFLVPVSNSLGQPVADPPTNPLQPSSAQNKTPTGAAESNRTSGQIGTTIADLKAKLTDVEGQELLDEIKQKLKSIYLDSVREWEAALALAAEADTFADQVSRASESLSEQKRIREEESNAAAPEVPPEASLMELDQLLKDRRELLETSQQEKQDLESDSQNRLLRLEEIKGEVKFLHNELEQISVQLGLEAPDGELAIVTEARRGLLAARELRALHAIAALENEEATYEVDRLVRPVKSDIVTSRVKRLQQEVDDLQAAADDRRRNEAQSRLDNARYIQRTYQGHSNSIVIQLTDKNVAIAERGLMLSRSLSQATSRAQRIASEADRLTKSSAMLQRRANHRNAALAVLMGHEKASLPDTYWHRRRIRERQEETSQLHGRLLEIQEKRVSLAVLDDVADRYSQGNPSSKDLVTELLKTQRDLLDENLAVANRLFEQLVNSSFAEQELIDQTLAHQSYIDERILWLQSDPMIGYTDLLSTRQALGWLFGRKHWGRLLASLRVDVKSAPVSWSILGLLFVVSMVFRPFMRHKLASLGTDASRGNCVSIGFTVKATALTLLLAGVIPVALAAIGWRCLATLDQNDAEFIRSVGAGLFAAAAVLWLLDALRTCCRPKGLGSSHFFWASLVNKSVRNTLKWYLLPATVLAAILTTIQLQGNAAYRSGLGRFAFLLLMLTTIGAIRQLLHPRFGIFSDYLRRYDRGWMAKLSWFWYPLTLGIPAALVLLAISGYFYTAWQLSARLYGTILIVLLLQLTGSLLFRWVLINRRRLAVQRYRERIARETGGGGSSETKQDPDVDLVEINVQTQRLIRSGLFCMAAILIAGIWADELPAFRLLDRTTLWYAARSAAGELVAITIADLLIALVVVIMTIIAGRNLPGLLEIAILQQLPIDSSIRYAITALGRYAITIFGIITTVSMLGISWDNIRWLVAAMGVGLGFGLQEVVANFVCGVILMFERPIRVGDVITLDDVTGKVSRIRIRATTLTDWDGKELVVPNKDLITGRLLNWTLTDNRNRVVVEVGIAYGTNVAKAKQIILSVAEDHPDILPEPTPSVTFESFGDSSLLLVLRAFLGSLDNRLGTIHVLHEQLHERLNEAGIEIAFPHRDINIRSLPPIVIESANGGQED